jgi:NodT family efflux transporter outer membrane factor (OMF) lipoprotein
MKPMLCDAAALRLLAGFALVLGLSACATRTDAPARPADLPPAYSEPAFPGSAAIATEWWRSFGSNDLSALIDAGLLGNPDLIIATERVRQAQAQVEIAGASLFPALSLGAGASRRETNGNDGSGASTINATLNASYEVDLWGQNTSLVRSSDFALRASRFDRETVRLTLVSGVASAYFQLLSLRARLSVARDNIAIAQRGFKVVDARARNGAASSLDLARQQSSLLGQQAAILPLQLQERQTLYALAILVDRAPQDFAIDSASVLSLTVPDVAPGLPSSLLVRRPDLASAEAQLAAANANVAFARAALLPAISLTGSAGIASGSLHDLVNAPAVAFSIGASLLQPIFNAGRLRAQVDIASSRERELVQSYRKAILAALADVENALAARSRLGAQELLLTQSLQQATRALRLAEVRYREGADDLIVLLDAQRTLFLTQDQVAQIRQSRLQATLDLFKALGGGWQAPTQ